MTTTAQSIGRKKRRGLFIGLVIAWIFIAGVVFWALVPPILQRLALVDLGLFWALWFVSLLLTWVLGKKNSGPLLLDCGSHPKRRSSAIFAAVYALLGLSELLAVEDPLAFLVDLFDLLAVEDPLTSSVDLVLAPFFCSFSLWFALDGLGRRQIRTNGIWLFRRLIEWQKLESYTWQGASEGESEATLVLQVKTRIRSSRRVPVRVPVEQRNRVAHLIKEHCPSFADLEHEAVVELEDGTQVLIHGVEMADYSYSSREFLRCDAPTGRKKIPFPKIREVVFSIHWPRTSSSADHLEAKVRLRSGDEIECGKPSAWHIHGFDENGLKTAIHMGRKGGPGGPGRTAEVTLRFVPQAPQAG